MALGQDAPLEVDWHQAYKEQLKKCKCGVASMGSELHSCELLKKKGESLPDEMKALLLKQLTASSKVLEGEKQECMAEMLNLPKTCKDETEAEAKQKEAADLAVKVSVFLEYLEERSGSAQVIFETRNCLDCTYNVYMMAISSFNHRLSKLLGVPTRETRRWLFTYHGSWRSQRPNHVCDLHNTSCSIGEPPPLSPSKPSSSAISTSRNSKLELAHVGDARLHAIKGFNDHRLLPSHRLMGILS